MRKLKSVLASAGSLIAVVAGLLLASTASAADMPYATYGWVYTPGIVLYYNSLGTPGAESFQIVNTAGAVQTWVCRRPYLGACTGVMNMNSTGDYIWISGVIVESTYELDVYQTILYTMPLPSP